MASNFSLFRFFIFLLLFIFILNPYTVVGPLAYFILPLIIIPFYMRMRFVGADTLILIYFLIGISLIGVISSFMHGIGQFSHFKVAVSLLAYIFLSYSIFMISRRCGLCFNDLVYLSLLVVFLNSLIILVQVLSPSFRGFTEAFLVLSGNVDWTDGYRYRGLASGGGASLSVLIPVSMVLVFYLYAERYLGIARLVFILSPLVVSLFFIGRTGFFLAPIVFLSFVFFGFKEHFLKVFSSALVVSFLVLAFGEEVKYFIVDLYGVAFYKYSFGFFLGGAEGLKDEGTIDAVVGFLKVMPVSFPEVLIGYGFYGVGEFYPWTDSGYSRMFLSVGYFFGLAFYFIFFFMFRDVILYKKYLFLTIGLVLLVAEVKEPLLFTGYASRVYVFLLASALFGRNFDKRNV